MAESPTVLRRRLGMELRKLREGAGMTIEEVARHLECSMSRVSRIETGKSPARQRDVRDMLVLYEVAPEDAHHIQLLNLAKQAQQKGWWSVFELSNGLETYVGLEASAASLRIFQNILIPGLLQTEEYARAVMRAASLRDVQDIDHLVDLRMRRQDLLSRDTPLELWAVIDEATLRRPIGGTAVMRAQLARILASAEAPNITIQVLPLCRGAHNGLDGPFTILTFPDSTDVDVVYVPSAAWNILLDREKDVRPRTLCFDHLRAEALPPDESAELIAAAADEYK